MELAGKAGKLPEFTCAACKDEKFSAIEDCNRHQEINKSRQ